MNRLDEEIRGATGSEFEWPGMSSPLAVATVFRLAGHQPVPHTSARISVSARRHSTVAETRGSTGSGKGDCG